MPFAPSHHCRIFYESLGDGPAVVLAHGRGGNAASWFQQAPALLEAGYRVITFDHRCFGRSYCPPEHFDRAYFADDLAAVLDAAGVERAAVVCQSMGGWTGLRLTVEQPGRVQALVLSNTTGGASTPAADAAIDAARRTFSEKGIASSAVAADFPARRPDLAYLYRHIGSLNVQLTDDLHSLSPAATSAAELGALAVPALFVTSDNDTIFPPGAIREIAGMVPGAAFVQLPGAGHSPYFETPDAFNETVLGFLGQHLSR